MRVGVAGWRQYGMAAAIVGFTSGLSLRSVPIFRPPTWRCSTCSLSSRWRHGTQQGAAFLATVLSIAAFDFLFVPPYYTFNVHEGPTS